MTEIRMSNEGIYSLIVKGLILIVLIWVFGLLFYSFVGSAAGSASRGIELDPIVPLFVISLVIVLLICFAVGKFLQHNTSIETREKELLIRKGLFIPKETKISYSDFKEARLAAAFFDFIDNLFGVSAISIENTKVFVVNGVKNPLEIVREVNDRIASNKRKGITIEDLAKEVKVLRDEVESLKAAHAVRKKESREEKREETSKRRFGFGPLEEEV